MKLGRWLVIVAGLGCSGPSSDVAPRPVPRPEVEIRRLDEARLAALAAVRVPEYRVELVRRGARELAASFAGDTPDDRALVYISACLACVAMDVAAWRARAPELAALWAPRGGDHLAVDAVSFAGAKAIAIAAVRREGARAHHLYQVHWNDGVAQLVAVCEGVVEDGAGAPPCVATARRAAEAYLRVFVGSSAGARN